MAAVDFNALRAQTLGSGFDEEAVTVNTRALIDKVLARYSGEWTVLRELIQNAADASATRVVIKFETLPSSTVPLPQNSTSSNLLLHTVQNHTLKRLVVSNNGQAFNENDWARLKRIAEGNPDETKIGAFGVGFYSTFADCEEPFVSSGREAMAFFWKNNSLFTRRLKLPQTESSMDTNFVLDYRDTTSSVPTLLPLTQFLANSLTFVGIEKIELWIDNWNILALTKKTSPSQEIPIPKDVDPKTTEGFMKVTNLSKELAQIDGEWMNIVGYKSVKQNAPRTNDKEYQPSLRKFFSRLAGTAASDEPVNSGSKLTESSSKDLSATVKTTIFLNVDTATIKTYTGQKFNEELERATKKVPPKTTKLAVLTAPYVDSDTLSAALEAGDVFGTVLPSKSGRIFIGFPTHQTTGLSAHISAPSVIPTVERESIDLNARYVRTWNMEMLRAAGIVCRIIWITEMTTIRSKIERQASGKKKIRQEDISFILPEAITTANNFTFRESTPSHKTGELLEDAFWRCGKSPAIEVLSTCGVLSTLDVRVAPKDLSFVEGVPVLPEKLVEEAKGFVAKLTDYGLISEVTVADLRNALESNSLTSQQLIEFMDWITKEATRGQLDKSAITKLLSVAVGTDGTSDESSGRLILLGHIKQFHNPSRIPVEMPVPDTVMPFKFTRGYSKHQLECLGWEELQIVPWIRWLLTNSKNRDVLSEDQDLTSSKLFSAQIFPLLSKQWDAISQTSKTTLVELLSAETVIPTKLGMRKPGDAYFPSVKLFEDLPTISGLGTVKDKVLIAFGVRKTVELGMVFDRLLNTKSGTEKSMVTPGSHVALVQYLASVRDDIPATDMQRLRNSPICPMEDRNAPTKESDRRYKVSELFEPRQQLRELGLPVLAWPGVYRGNSPEGRLLSSLGLRTVPKVEEMISILATTGAKGDLPLRDKALSYFLSFHHTNGYSQFDYSSVKQPFLPVEGEPTRLSTPSQCFVDEGASLLGFNVLKREWQTHAAMFGVKRHPPIDVCIGLLAQRKLGSHSEGRAIFAYFAGRLVEINSHVIPRLQDLPFVPLVGKHKEKEFVRGYASPRNVFLGDSETFGEIFDYVDFGHEANSFLLKCGSKLEPTKIEIAQILVREPARISSTFKNPEKYMALLRSLAESIGVLKKNKELFKEMKRAPFVLASRHIPRTPMSARRITADDDDVDDYDDESQGIMEWQLCVAQEAIIVDDFVNYSLFKTDILAAPQEESLEDFYFTLGAPTLSSLVEEAAKHGPKAADQRPAQKLQKTIQERVALFLHEQPPDSIKHDTKWLEKHLTVQLVSSITLRRSLKGRNLSHSEKRTAVVTQINGQYTLWIVGDRPDFYQVSQALVSLLLNRPKLHSPITLEMLLKTDLYELRARGFNVSRILRQKAAEARLAESKRQQALEAEQRRIEEQQKAWESTHEQGSNSRTPTQKQMIGAFPDSPDPKTTMAESSHNTGLDVDGDNLKSAQRLFSNFTKTLGFGGSRGPRPANEQHPSAANPVASQDAPPPYSQHAGNVGGQAVTSPHRLQENLLSAIKKTRPHNSSDVFSRGGTNTVSETKSYCDERPAHELALVAEIKYGIQMFLSQNPSQQVNSSTFLQQNTAGLTIFADVIKAVGDVFSLNPRTLNIFYETGGKTIAFNRNGSIFCNYLYFKQLHEERLLRNLNTIEGYAEAEAEAAVYWWVVLCHELAHNLVQDHSSDHSYYTEGFVAQYFLKLVNSLGVKNQTRLQVLPPSSKTTGKGGSLLDIE